MIKLIPYFHLVVSISTYLLIGSSICSQTVDKQVPYKLTIYEAVDCSYCKFASSQFRSIYQQYYWQNIIDFVVVNCKDQPHECRQNINRPRVVLSYKNDSIIKQITGVYSKLYFRDLVLDTVDKNPIKIIDVVFPGKYKYKSVANKEETLDYYCRHSKRIQEIKNKRINIIVQSKKQKINNEIKASQKKQTLKNTQIIQTSQSFRFNLKQLVVIALPIVFVVFILILIRINISSKHKKTHTIKIPTIEQQD